MKTYYYHGFAVLPGGKKKTIKNRTEDQIMNQCVLPYITTKTITANWGKKPITFQVLELRIFRSEKAWDTKTDGEFEVFIERKKLKNLYANFNKRAQVILGTSKHRVFIVMPIQGDKYGKMEDQRIHAEYNARFSAIEKLLTPYGCVAIRIDRECTIRELVSTIKSEIKRSKFVIADLTDERPSCYFEAGYAEALNKTPIYIASKDSVINAGKQTKIHFDIHMNVNFFSNHNEMSEKLISVIEKNKELLLGNEPELVSGDK